jgi:hypothetical protein
MQAVRVYNRRLSHILEDYGSCNQTYQIIELNKALYDALLRIEAQALDQLQTGHSKLRGFLAMIRAAETSKCECG